MPRLPFEDKSVSCTGKEGFSSMDMARKIAKRMSGKHSSTIAPYKCRCCEFYHVGEKVGHGFTNGKALMKRRTKGRGCED